MNYYDSMDQALVGVLGEIEERGEWVRPRGFSTKEISLCAFGLRDPRARTINIKARRWSPAYAAGELCWHLSASNDVQSISYYSAAWRDISVDGQTIHGGAYGREIFGPGTNGITKWERAKRTLQEDHHTRRGSLHFANDQNSGDMDVDVPCITHVQFMRRRGRLDCYSYMRSNDVIWGLCYDAYFVTMLQEMMALELGVPLGEYHHVATSMHYYERHATLAQEILRDEIPDALPMPPMTDIHGLAELLRVEKALRLNRCELANGCLERLTPYWREVARPLVERAMRKHAMSSPRELA